MIHYFYKITNKLNGKYYFGVHNTNDINDGYMGSGINIRKAIRKYGIENFTKEIVREFDTEEEVFAFEKDFVTEEVINDPNCYNMATGGQGGELSKNTIAVIDREGNIFGVSKDDPRWDTGEIVSVIKGTKRTDKNKENIRTGVNRYYETNEGVERRDAIKADRQAYWRSDDGVKVREEISERMKDFHKTETGRAAYEKSRETLKRNGVSQRTQETWRNMSKAFWESEEGKDLRRTMNKGHDNPKYGKGGHYKVTDIIDNKVILEDVCNSDLKKYFAVRSFDASVYAKSHKPYKGRYGIELI